MASNKKKRGRPKVPANRKKTAEIRFAVTESGWATIAAAADDRRQTIAEYCRRRLGIE